MWRAIYGAVPEKPGPYSVDWAEAGGSDRFLEAARRHCREKPVIKATAGDLILFRWRENLPAKHAAILVAPDRFVHAYEGSAVVVSALVPQWRKRIAAVLLFPRSGPSAEPDISETTFPNTLYLCAACFMSAA